jgi:hypothetical protein
MRQNQIYTTTDYDLFTLRTANREIDMAHVSRIAKSMMDNGWRGAPIEVSEIPNSDKLQIEDGQHRFTACKKTNTPIKFMVVNSKDIYDLARQNSIKKSWKGCDYIRAYANDGNYNYKRLANLMNEFPNITLSDILDVIAGKHKQDNLKKGYIRITDEQFFKAREILAPLSMMYKSLKDMGIKTVSNYKRVLTILLVHDVIDPQRMIDKIDKYGIMLLPKSVTKEQALRELEVIYNYHQQKNTTVMFRERLKNV